ncbi:DeoR family transcriptional regulator [Microbacterium sp. MAH-37]|nr:DeoR family transcriptional regulator [Microbacterium sp. MAH-37]
MPPGQDGRPADPARNGAAGKTPFGLQRRERIMQEIRQHGSANVSDMAARLGFSELTVRRDINALAQQGLVTRVHGGAVLRSSFEPALGAAVGGDPRAPRFVIGMVVPSLDYYWPSIVHGARAQATQLRARFVLRTSTRDVRDNRRQIEALLGMPGMQGLIVAPNLAEAAGLEMLKWLDGLPIPVVLAERRIRPEASSWRLESVVTDHANGAMQAVHHLYEAGHRRIGLLAERRNPTARFVRQGWRSALTGLGLDVSPDDDIRFDAEGRDAAIDRVLERCRSAAMTAVLVLADPHALALEQLAIDLGIRVPADLAIVAYDDELARLGDPAITAVRPPKQALGREAVNLLIARLEDGANRPAHQVVLSPEIHIRESSLPAEITVDTSAYGPEPLTDLELLNDDDLTIG